VQATIPPDSIPPPLTFTGISTPPQNQSAAGGNALDTPPPHQTAQNESSASEQELPENAESQVDVADDPLPLLGIPLYSSTHPSWSLLNLILAALGVLLTIITITKKVLLRKNKYRRIPLILGTISPIISAVIFLIFQDTRNLMTWVDFWTIVHLALLIISLLSLIFTAKERKKS
jgi:hypothetical protein